MYYRVLQVEKSNSAGLSIDSTCKICFFNLYKCMICSKSDKGHTRVPNMNSPCLNLAALAFSETLTCYWLKIWVRSYWKALTRVPYSRVKFFVTVCEKMRHLERFFRNYGSARATPSSIDHLSQFSSK